MELESSVVLIRNRTAASYIERVGQRVVGSFSTPEFRPSFKVLADPTLYSVGLPGGPVYLTHGLARLAKSESELAALIAHESAHALLRHVTSAISRAARVRVRVAFATASRGDLTLLKALEVIDLDSGLQSGFFTYGETDEQDALDLAGKLLAASGYDRLSLSNVLDSIVIADELRASPFSSFHSEAARLIGRPESVTHPEPSVAANREFKKFTTRLDARDVAPSKSLAGMLRAKPKSTDEVGRSGPKEIFLTRTYQFAYPSAWAPTYRGPSEALQVVPKGGIAKPAGTEGVVVIGMLSGVVPASSSDEPLIDEVLNQLESVRPGLTLGAGDAELPEPRDGLELFAFQGDSPLAGQRELAWVAAAKIADRLFYLLMIAPEGDFEAVKRIFREAYESIEIRADSGLTLSQ